MKRKITVIAMSFLITAAIGLLAGCGPNNTATTPEPNRWLELLRVLPENEITLVQTYLHTEGYVELMREEYSDVMEERHIAFAELIAYNHLPLFYATSFTDQEWSETLGFGVMDIDASLVASSGPPKYYQAVRGNFTREDVENAARTGPLNEHLEIISYEGYDIYSWGADFSLQLDWSSGLRKMGRGHRLVYVDGFALWVLWTDGAKEMIDAYEGNIPSLADNEDYKLLAGVLEDMDTVSAYFTSNIQSAADVREMFKDRFDEAVEEGRGQMIEDFEKGPFLKPFSSFATGAGKDEQGTYMVIALANTDESTARANADLLEQRINETNINLPFMGRVRKLTDDGQIESMEITSQGRLTVAKLYGPVYLAWDNFDLVSGAYMPLLLHE